MNPFRLEKISFNANVTANMLLRLRNHKANSECHARTRAALAPNVQVQQLNALEGNVFGGYEALVILHVEKPGFLVEGHLGDARDLPDFGAHGVGAAGSEDAALLLHTPDPEGEPG